MTGAYLRVKRHNDWKNIEIEYLTKEELVKVLEKKDTLELIEWIAFLCNQLAPIAAYVDKGTDDANN